jgi:hypothetical protein
MQTRAFIEETAFRPLPNHSNNITGSKNIAMLNLVRNMQTIVKTYEVPHAYLPTTYLPTFAACRGGAWLRGVITPSRLWTLLAQHAPNAFLTFRVRRVGRGGAEQEQQCSKWSYEGRAVDIRKISSLRSKTFIPLRSHLRVCIFPPPSTSFSWPLVAFVIRVRPKHVGWFLAPYGATAPTLPTTYMFPRQ